MGILSCKFLNGLLYIAREGDALHEVEICTLDDGLFSSCDGCRCARSYGWLHQCIGYSYCLAVGETQCDIAFLCILRNSGSYLGCLYFVELRYSCIRECNACNQIHILTGDGDFCTILHWVRSGNELGWNHGNDVAHWNFDAALGYYIEGTIGSLGRNSNSNLCCAL